MAKHFIHQIREHTHQMKWVFVNDLTFRHISTVKVLHVGT